LTPETLRKLADNPPLHEISPHECYISGEIVLEIRAHADAWEAERETLSAYIADHALLEEGH
jgi:hypothetical protein